MKVFTSELAGVENEEAVVGGVAVEEEAVGAVEVEVEGGNDKIPIVMILGLETANDMNYCLHTDMARSLPQHTVAWF